MRQVWDRPRGSESYCALDELLSRSIISSRQLVELLSSQGHYVVSQIPATNAVVSHSRTGVENREC
ncbi:hypothetical protein CCM_08386 [Cordyceps militaris CM01]|uniref:Uncharacterized protein n=1 Tax=Cordyceps militaris (strain CM01) TaxID=983644 RepID=G3JR47_CORMM|nr:uncharacterized protein CCM_08386 [Cordyceps militaris CM01]EGX88343.1 hypothetical protein CCM_08386 [Cordyceps militaris CM01]